MHIGYSSLKQLITEIKTITDCPRSQLHSLATICSNILKKYNQKPCSIKLEIQVSAYCAIGIAIDDINDVNDIDSIVNMNFELSEQVAASTDLDSCPVIAVFVPKLIK